ncbi:NAD(P)/FAD-dependent oxidoreductase, partial [Mesorhizobium sp. M7A.F.Ca.US.014.04.1.1]
MLEIAPTKQAAAWLESLAQALAAGDAAAASNLFVDDCYWRDLLTFTWNITTVEGRAAIADMLATTLATAKPSAWRLTGEATSDDGTIEAWFSFETVVARGEGIMRLRDGRCRTLFTAMADLKGFEERKGAARPLGVRHKADPQRETWSE